MHSTRNKSKKGAGALRPPAVLLYLFQRPSGISGLAKAQWLKQFLVVRSGGRLIHTSGSVATMMYCIAVYLYIYLTGMGNRHGTV